MRIFKFILAVLILLWLGWFLTFASTNEMLQALLFLNIFNLVTD